MNNDVLCKEIINSFPDQISRVRIIFQKTGQTKSSQVDVTAGDVKAYALGAIKPEALLASLEMAEVEYNGGASQGMTVVAGPLLDQRLVLLSRIEALKSKGTNVKAFRDLFDNIERETAAQASEAKISTDVSYLADHLSEQEGLVKSARVSSGNSSRGDFNSKCAAMQAKFDAWQRQGKDVSQLNYSLSLLRQMANDPDPSKRAMAAAAIDSMEHTAAAAQHH